MVVGKGVDAHFCMTLVEEGMDMNLVGSKIIRMEI